jgi:hypothetical protein
MIQLESHVMTIQTPNQVQRVTLCNQLKMKTTQISNLVNNSRKSLTCNLKIYQTSLKIVKFLFKETTKKISYSHSIIFLTTHANLKRYLKWIKIQMKSLGLQLLDRFLDILFRISIKMGLR